MNIAPLIISSLLTAPAPAGNAAAPTYYGRVASIVQNHCVECHHKGAVAPFGLETYEQVSGKAGTIKKVLDRQIMPPWFAKPTPGHASLFSNDRSLSDDERRDLLTWIDAGKPAGNPADAPPPKQFASDWLIGKPDLVVQLPHAVNVKADGTMPYQWVVAETGLTEDKWVKAIEVQPTARDVVHHALVFVIPAAKPGEKKANLAGIRAAEGGFYGIYVPGSSTLVYPEGFAKELPAGSRLVFQLHLTPSGKATIEQTKIGFIFTDKKPEHIVKVAGIRSTKLNIPPGAPDHVEVATLTVPADVHALSFLPHMHLRGKSIRYDFTTPDGKTTTPLDIPRYDFNWQLVYRLREPMPVPRGTKITVTGVFDNSSGNPANPDPTATVHWGEQTTDEMLLGYIEYYVDSGDGNIGRGGFLQRLRQALGRNKPAE
jgi:hypothetical protein